MSVKSSARMNFMAQVHCPVNGNSATWANSATKDKTGQTLRCTKCGKEGHDKVKAR